MFRAFAALVLLLTLPRLCHADEPKQPVAATKAAPTPQRAEPTETLIRMTVQPMAAPIPALKYQLLPEGSEMNPGNPIQGYMKCFMEEHNFFFSKQAWDNRDKWLEMPLKDLPLKEMRNWGYFGPRLKRADAAARLDTPDWQILLDLKKGYVALTLPDVTQLRQLSQALKVRIRGEIAGGNFDKALVTAKTMFAMSRHFAAHPTLVGNTVGMSVAEDAIGPLEEMVQQPGCPNLYWALSALPSPLVSLYEGLHGHRDFLGDAFAILNRTSPMTAAELQKIVDRLEDSIYLAGETSVEKGEVRKSLATKASDETYLIAARGRLVEAGADLEKLKHLPPLQVILQDELLAFNERHDDEIKAMLFPYWQITSVRTSSVETSKTLRSRGSAFAPYHDLMADLSRRMQVRLEQRIALLRCVEAIRLYGADHEGRLPARLDDVPVPVPVDPVTGKPFTYRLNGATAALRGTSPPGPKIEASYNVFYEVTMKPIRASPKEPRAK